MEEVFPQVVHTDSRGYKSVAYSRLVAPLIEAVKALKTENEALKSALKDVNARLERFEQRWKTPMLATVIRAANQAEASNYQ